MNALASHDGADGVIVIHTLHHLHHLHYQPREQNTSSIEDFFANEEELLQAVALQAIIIPPLIIPLSLIQYFEKRVLSIRLDS